MRSTHCATLENNLWVSPTGNTRRSGIGSLRRTQPNDPLLTSDLAQGRSLDKLGRLVFSRPWADTAFHAWKVRLHDTLIGYSDSFELSAY